MGLEAILSLASSFKYYLLALFALSAVVVNLFLNYRKCHQIPGPWLASVSDLWLMRATFMGRGHLDAAEALEKYGSVARISPIKVITNDPAIWRHMSAPRSNFTRGTWYDSMTVDPKNKNSLSQRDDKLHSALKSKIIRGYSGKDIPSLDSNIDSQICDLMTLIRRTSAQGDAMDWALLAQYFTLDVLTQIAYEEPFGFITQNKDVFQYIEKVEEFLAILEFGSNFPWIQSLLSSWIMAPLQPRPTDKTGMGAMLGVAQRVTRRRMQPGAEKRNDMLGSFIKYGLTEKEVENEANLQILGGSDSTATTIRTTVLYILSNPTVYSKLIAEIDSTLHTVSSPVISSAESKTLPYLQACIKEGLRIFPPLTGLQGKLSPPQGETVNGIFIPGNIEVCWNPHSMQRRKEIYGPDADVFRPERWLPSSYPSPDSAETQERLAHMDRTIDLVFGHGKYGCLGKTIAWLEMDKIYHSLFRNFDMGLVNPLEPMKTRCHGVHVQKDMWVVARERAPGRS